MATTCVILLAEERDPRIRVRPSLYGIGELTIDLGSDRIVLSDHQAYELEAALARHREARAARPRPVPCPTCSHGMLVVEGGWRCLRCGNYEPVRPVPAEACTGCAPDADTLPRGWWWRSENLFEGPDTLYVQQISGGLHVGQWKVGQHGKLMAGTHESWREAIREARRFERTATVDADDLMESMVGSGAANCPGEVP